MMKSLLFLTLIYVCIGAGKSLERNLSQQRLHSEHHAINQRSLYGKGSSKTPKSKSSKSSKSSKTPKSKGGKGGKGGKGSSKAPKSSKSYKGGKGGKGTKATSSKSPKSSKTPKSSKSKSSKSPKSTKCHKGKGGKGHRGTDCYDNVPSSSPNGKPTAGCTKNLRSIVEEIFGNIGSGKYQEDALGWLQSDVKDNAGKCDDSAYITRRYALATLYYSTGGSDWNINNGWLGRENECDSWFGVVCDDTNQVVKLSLATNNLTGPLPEELFTGITTFTTIEIFANNISGGLPSGIENSPLTILDIETNDFSGNLFTEEFLGLSSSLEVLYASFNDFTGSIPSRISKFKKLKNFWVAGNGLSGAIPTEIGALSSMELLYLYDNKFDGQIPTEIGNLSKLRHLRLYENNLSGAIPASIGDLGNLEDLELDSMGLEGTIPDSIQNLSELKTIRAFDNDLSGTIPVEIRRLKNLVTVALHNNSLTGDIPDFSQSTNLQRLDLSNNLLNGELDTKLFEMPNLALLYLFQNKLIGKIPENFGGSTSLRDIYLYDNFLTGSIPNVVNPSLSNLEELLVSENKIGGDMPESICELRLTKLVTLRADCAPSSGKPPQVPCRSSCCTSCRVGKGI